MKKKKEKKKNKENEKQKFLKNKSYKKKWYFNHFRQEILQPQ
jgi:hypothetical protein